ncbi:MAG: CoA ester lyase [Pseudomonadota bacterium]
MTLLTFRSFLFVPGDRPDRFGKAIASGADAVVIDLEDAVAPDAKRDARNGVMNWYAEAGESSRVGIRINSPRTREGCEDIAALAGSAIPFIMVPKTQTAADLEIVTEAMGQSGLMAVVECGRGLMNAAGIARQAPAGILFGGADYSASLGAQLSDWDAMLTARGMIMAATAAAGIPAYDVPYIDVRDPDGLRETSFRALRMGFSGRACIHPEQVETVNDVFSPSKEDLEDAKAIMDAIRKSDGGAVLHKGKLVDQPIVLAAERMLAKASIKGA